MAKRKKPTDEQNQENQENLNDDSFGLPDVEYKPLEQQDPEPIPQAETRESTTSTTTTSSYEERREPVTEHRSTYSSTYMEEENKSKAPVIIGVVVALVVLAASFLIYQFVWKPMKDKEAEQVRIDAIKQREAAEQLRQRQEAEEAERQRLAAEAAAANAQPTEGEIVTLSDRTRRYYVVVSSAVDGDLVMDYARRLSAKGVSTKIIPPFGRSKFSRLAIGDYDTFATAQTGADAAKTEYGGEVWVLRF
jgi:hypothetical protein